ncbi:MAG: hypothetical protein ABEJ36_02700 [Candidatus Nanosalina sp.]
MTTDAWWEEEDDEVLQSDGGDLHRRYRIFNVEREDGGIVLLNFSEDGGYFPDYTAELVGNGDLEEWEINTEDGPLEEISVEPDYAGRYELASRLQTSYEENL